MIVIKIMSSDLIDQYNINSVKNIFINFSLIIFINSNNIRLYGIQLRLIQTIQLVQSERGFKTS